jgi:hypothetical protein
LKKVDIFLVNHQYLGHVHTKKGNLVKKNGRPLLNTCLTLVVPYSAVLGLPSVGLSVFESRAWLVLLELLVVDLPASENPVLLVPVAAVPFVDRTSLVPATGEKPRNNKKKKCPQER